MMDTRNGNLMEVDAFNQLPKKEKKHFVRVEKRNLNEKQILRMRVNRSEPCPCGSGKKFKHCCQRIPVSERSFEGQEIDKK